MPLDVILKKVMLLIKVPDKETLLLPLQLLMKDAVAMMVQLILQYPVVHLPILIQFKSIWSAIFLIGPTCIALSCYAQNNLSYLR